MLQPKLIRVVPIEKHRLILYYETGEIKVFDVKSYINGPWLSELECDDYFKTVHLLPDGTGIQWINGRDIAPHELYECSESRLDIILREIARCADEVFKEELSKVVLYGSYARGDYNAESDIDIMILVDLPAEDISKYKKPLISLSSELGLEYDVVITVNIKDTETFNKYSDVTPYYQNIIREGIEIEYFKD